MGQSTMPPFDAPGALVCQARRGEPLDFAERQTLSSSVAKARCEAGRRARARAREWAAEALPRGASEAHRYARRADGVATEHTEGKEPSQEVAVRAAPRGDLWRKGRRFECAGAAETLREAAEDATKEEYTSHSRAYSSRAQGSRTSVQRRG